MKAILIAILACFGIAAALIIGLVIYLIVLAIIDHVKEKDK